MTLSRTGTTHLATLVRSASAGQGTANDP
jgi:hypothetical protein